MSEIAALLKKFEIDDEHLQLVRQIGEKAMPKIDKHLDGFYAWMSKHPEYDEFFGDDSARLKRVRKMQVGYWNAFFEAKIDQKWLEQREHVGEVHANIDLPNDIYFAGVSFSGSSIAHTISTQEDTGLLDKIDAFQRLLFLDSYIVINKISEIQRAKINASARELVEMSTPVTPIYKGILLLPLLGLIDSVRAKEIMQRTLDAISKYRASVLLLDISGVSVMDTQVANQLMKIAKATKFMGCETIISGLSPNIAQTLVELGVDTGNINTCSSLEDSFKFALERLQLHIGTNNRE